MSIFNVFLIALPTKIPSITDYLDFLPGFVASLDNKGGFFPEVLHCQLFVYNHYLNQERLKMCTGHTLSKYTQDTKFEDDDRKSCLIRVIG